MHSVCVAAIHIISPPHLDPIVVYVNPHPISAVYTASAYIDQNIAIQALAQMLLFLSNH